MTQKGLLILVCLCFGLDDLDNLRIDGVVTDEHGKAIPGASIEARATETGIVRRSSSGPTGFYRISALSPGGYQITVEAAGFRKATVGNLKGASGVTLRCNVTLSLAPIESRIEVSSDVASAAIDPGRTFNGDTISRQTIDRLPLESRNPFEVLYTLPGIAAPAYDTRFLDAGDDFDNFLDPPEEAGVVSLQGGTPYSNNFTIDGFDNNDDRAARERFLPSADAVEEVQVITSQFAAEYGRASGGRINIRLRGGTNTLRGRASYFLRDSSLNSNSFFRNADPQRGFRLPFKEQFVSTSIGGPLATDHVFYFAAMERGLLADSASIAALLPVDRNPRFELPRPNGPNLGHVAIKGQAAMNVNGGADVGLYDLTLSTPRVSDSLQARTDIHPGARHVVSALLTLARERDERSFPGGRRTPDTVRPKGRSSDSIAIAHTYARSETFVNEGRVQFSNLRPLDGPTSSRPVVIIDIEDPRAAGGNAASVSRAGTLLSGSSNLSASSRREVRWQIQDIATIFRGASSVRTGVDIHRINSTYDDLEDTSGTFYFSSPADFLIGKAERFRQRFDTESKLLNTYTGAFLQAERRLLPSLNILVGLRWERESIVKDNNNAGLRFAVAWSPGEDGQTVVRAGFGAFFNRALLRTLDDFALTTRSLVIDTNLPAHSGLLEQLDFPSGLSKDDIRVGNLGIRESGFQRRLESKLRIPESYQASIAVEHRLGRNVKAEVNYLFNRGAHLWRESNANAPQLALTGAATFADYLTSRDFDNRRDVATGLRPITSTGNADVVRFDRSETISRVFQDVGRRIVVFGLANTSTSNSTSAIKAALSAVRDLRPDPNLEQVEELHSSGSSFYHGLSFEMNAELAGRGTLRGSYTLSKCVDDGVVNTSSPLVAGDLRRERSLSLLDSRHRFAFSGSTMFMQTSISFVALVNSPRPFNIGINGNDRNLDDVNNDRPNAIPGTERIGWIDPRKEAIDEARAASDISRLSLPMIGTSGNLARNAGRGPWQHTINLRFSRTVAAGDRLRFTPIVEAFNPLNATVFSFGAEYVDWNGLTPRRTIKPRTVRIGIRVDF